MSHDAIIIGSGHNGLVTAIYLARAGWDVVVLERNTVAGGAMQTAEVTRPGFQHDLFATNLSLFAGSPFVEEFKDKLEQHGLAFCPASDTFASVFPDNSFLGVSTDIEQTVQGFSPADADAWRALAGAFPAAAARLFPLLAERVPSWGLAKTLLKNIRGGGWEWLYDTTQLVVSSPREFACSHFTDPKVQSLVSTWGMHLDFAPDIAGGALFPYLECMANQHFGMVFGKGGVVNAVNAMTGLLAEYGGTLRLQSPVQEIIIENNEARGVVLANGEQRRARRAVIANLTPGALFGKLLPLTALPASFARRVRQYQYGPGTVMIHLAMDGLPAWQAGERLQRFAYVHIAPYMADMTRTYNESMAGLLPTSPTLVVAQPTVIDPGRAPAGKHIVSIQVRTVPAQIRGDAAGTISDRDWNDCKEAFADRVIDKVNDYAPGFADRILQRVVLSPLDLESANPSLVGGCNIGGSMHLRQNFFMRPFPGWSNYKTPIHALYMVGAGTWPGGGTGAGSGRLLGRMLTRWR